MNSNYNLGSLSDWSHVGMGEMLELEVPQAAGYRKVELDVFADRPVVVRCIGEDDEWIVGLGEGIISCSFGISATSALVVLGDKDADVMVRMRARSQTIPESLDPSYTTIEPRPAGPSEEIRRLMQIVKINSQRREQMLLDEIRGLKSQMIATPAPAPEPAPQPASAASDEPVTE